MCPVTSAYIHLAEILYQQMSDGYQEIMLQWSSLAVLGVLMYVCYNI